MQPLCATATGKTLLSVQAVSQEKIFLKQVFKHPSTFVGGAACPNVSVSGTLSNSMVQFFLKNIIVVMRKCCYYKYGYCYYCSPGKVIIPFYFFLFLFFTLSFGVLLDRGIT